MATGPGARPPLLYGFGGWRLDPRRRLLTDPSGEAAAVTAKAYEALLLLVQRSGELVSRAELMRALWPTTIVEENNLNQAISSLRRTLGEGYIATVAGKGYQFVVPVTAGGDFAAHADAGRIADAPPYVSLPPAARRRRLPNAAMAIGSALIVLAIGVLLYLARSDFASVRSKPLGRVTRVTPLTTFPGDETMPSFSPDGTRIAFAWARDGGDSDIYVLQVGTSDPVRLTQGGGVSRDPAWSPDGTQIAFLRQHDPLHLDLMVVPAIGGVERKLQAVRMTFVSREGSPRVAWTPDSHQLIFTTQREVPANSRQFELHVIALDTRSERPLKIAQHDTEYDTSPALTRDGRRLAFVRFRNGQRLGSLMVQDLGPDLAPLGPPRPVPHVEDGVPHSLFWSRDGRFLRFLVGTDILEWNIDVGVRTVHTIPTMSLTIGAMALVTTDSGDHAAITQVHSNVDIWSVSLDPETHVAVGPPIARVASTSYELHPRFSPDGHSLAFISGRSGKSALWVADADGAHPRQVSDLDQMVTGFPRWSPDGTRIAFHTSSPNSERMIYVVDLAGDLPTKLGGGCCPGGWSGDGRYLYVGDFAKIDSVARMSVPGGQRERLFEGVLAAETPDGKLLLYAKDPEPGLFARSLQGNPAQNPEQKLLDDFVAGPLAAYIPVKRGVYYLGYTPGGKPRAFRYYDFSSRSAHDVLAAPRGVSLGLTVSPDERELLYSADQENAGADIALFDFANP
ncbi:MAG TPA: winged helix-turn-helix domain-containing protein [Steroidobacteraceae bacterium]|nr:winged helix-turn-helix domain-containing protein [Steroidobacteraceae bacterium]